MRNQPSTQTRKTAFHFKNNKPQSKDDTFTATVNTQTLTTASRGCYIDPVKRK